LGGRRATAQRDRDPHP